MPQKGYEFHLEICHKFRAEKNFATTGRLLSLSWTDDRQYFITLRPCTVVNNARVHHAAHRAGPSAAAENCN